MTPRQVVIVGASLAGVRAAEALRRRGHDGPLTVIGTEIHQPYDRPPLSKRFLTGAAGPDDLGLRIDDDLAAEWRLGQTATGLDLDRRRLTLSDGEELGFHGLVLASGAHPRTLPALNPRTGTRSAADGTRAMAGVHVLRTLDDAAALRADLDHQPRVVVIGGGFIGLEVAASCRARGLEVTVVEFLELPLVRAIGEEMGRRLADLHIAQGVILRLGTAVEGLVGADRVSGVRVAGGEIVPADVVVVAVGVAPSTGWLEGSGIDLADGVMCDASLRVLVGGRPRPDVVAAGDVARWWHSSYGEAVRIEHWTNAAEQGEVAAATLLLGDEAPPYAPVPYFWSDQYRTKLQFVGRRQPGDDIAVVEGAINDERFVAAYGRQGRLVGALGFGRPARVMAYGRMVGDGAAFPPPSP